MSQLELSKQEPQDRFEPQNRFPNCVFVKLHSAPTQLEESASPILTPTSRSQATSDREIDLKLTIRFGEQEIKAPGASVRFGLKQGKLKLKLENGKIPLEKMGLTAPFALEIKQEVQHERSNGIEANLAAASSLKGSKTNKESIKTECKLYQYRTEGTETAAVWVFEAKTEEKILKGQLTKEWLGTVEISNKPCHIEAKFEVRGRSDLYLLESEGLLRAEKLSDNKTALLTTEFFLRFIEPKLQPYLSRVEVQL